VRNNQATVPNQAPNQDQGALERARWELAAMAGRLRTLDRELAETHEEHALLLRELAREREHNRRLRQSDTYRLGKAAVALVRNPIKAVPRLSRAVLRRLRRGKFRSRRTAAASQPRLGDAAAARKRHPVHLYVAIGLDATALRSFVQTLNQRLLVNADHTPVVVTDCPSFALLRDLGVILEYLPDRHTWQRHRPDDSWDEVLTERISWFYRDHASVRTVIVDRLHPPTLASLLR
jgi:hypothetical protein